jgi:ribosomal protein S18 acetylase RimI-like enzyme
LSIPTEGSARDDVILVKDVNGAVSLELMPVREGVARGFLRFSPRNLRLTDAAAKQLSDELSARPYSRILVQDNRKGLLRKTLLASGWSVRPAIDPSLKNQCSIVSTYDIPIDETLVDSSGGTPDISTTSFMSGISIELEGRKAWAFYTDDGETARVVAEKDRKQGMLVASSSEDMFEAADSLVSFLAATKKSWAVFSSDLGRFIRRFDPTVMWRMVLDRSTPYQHSGVLVSSQNKAEAVKLFSEYYDESSLQASFRLRRYRSNSSYAVYLVDGGFVITRLDGDTGLIFDIYVTPSRQGQGLGAELMRCGLTDLAGKVSSCYLHTSYPRAKRLYEKFGFKTTYSQLGIRLDEIALTPPSAR